MRFVHLLVLVLVGLAVALGAVSLGLPPIAATTHHWSITEWLLETAMENGVERRAAGILAPDDLDDPARLQAGGRAYDAMCVTCHAAPGVEASVIAEGLLPAPPELAQKADEWSPSELFWIAKHGIRMTGMPAFGPTHSDREIWDVTAFVRQLPRMSEAEYRRLTGGGADRGGEPAHRGHAH